MGEGMEGYLLRARLLLLRLQRPFDLLVNEKAYLPFWGLL